MAEDRNDRFVSRGFAGVTVVQGDGRGEPLLAGRAARRAAARPIGNLDKPLEPSAELGAIVGTDRLSRAEAVGKVWAYIKRHKLQNPADGREVLADDKLARLFGKPKVTMFEMSRHLSAHLKG